MTCNTCKANKVCDHNKYGFENCNNYIPKDAVEVVRCKDCVHYKADTEFCQANHKGYCEYDNILKPQQHFCRYGERKDT